VVEIDPLLGVVKDGLGTLRSPQDALIPRRDLHVVDGTEFLAIGIVGTIG
jgi:hypothetical protein